jgi:hypothetical protein
VAWEEEQIDAYLTALTAIVEHSGGQVITRPVPSTTALITRAT